jgi:two-component system, OmpR family, response regulator RegX3
VAVATIGRASGAARSNPGAGAGLAQENQIGMVGKGVGAEGSRMALVLVVEDEESFSDALSYMLRKEGFEVAVCPTGTDALAVFDRDGADLVLLDLVLPGPPGTEVCRSLRERSDVPVIMLSAKDTEIDKAVGLELGADDYLTKPFTWRELAARIQAVLNRPED